MAGYLTIQQTRTFVAPINGGTIIWLERLSVNTNWLLAYGWLTYCRFTDNYSCWLWYVWRWKRLRTNRPDNQQINQP